MSLFLLNSDSSECDQKDLQTNVDDPNSSQSEAQIALQQFWPKVTEEIKAIATMDLKQQVLPLARIKKIMKLDDEVKMISAEAPLLFAKAAEIFIHELTLRAWIHTEDNKRRTLQRNDIAMAITKFDQFDFLIDIVPRDEIKQNKPREEATGRTVGTPDQMNSVLCNVQTNEFSTILPTPMKGLNAKRQIATPIRYHEERPNSQFWRSGEVNPSNVQIYSENPTYVHYYLQLAQQAQQQLQHTNIQTNTSPTTNAATTAAPTQSTIQIVQPQVQTLQVNSLEQNNSGTATTTTASPAIIQNPTSPQPSANANVQIVQQIVTPSGEIQQIPIQLTPQQLQLIRMQLQSNSNQPLILQAAPSLQPQVIQVSQQNATGQTVFLTENNGNAESE